MDVTCSACKEQFYSEKQFVDHFMAKHTAQTLDPSDDVALPNGSLNKPMHTSEGGTTSSTKCPLGQNVDVCEICGKLLTSRTLPSHIFTHIGAMPYYCQICLFSCISKLHLQQHLVLRGHGPNNDSGSVDGLLTYGNLYECEKCYCCFSSWAELTVHYAHHVKQMPIICKTCKLIFEEIQDYIIHCHIHKATLNCDICHNFFIERSDLLKHVLSHNKSKLFRKFDNSVCLKDSPIISSHSLYPLRRLSSRLAKDNTNFSQSPNPRIVTTLCKMKTPAAEGDIKIADFKTEGDVGHLCEVLIQESACDFESIPPRLRKSVKNYSKSHELTLNQLNTTSITTRSTLKKSFEPANRTQPVMKDQHIGTSSAPKDNTILHNLKTFSIVLHKLPRYVRGTRSYRRYCKFQKLKDFRAKKKIAADNENLKSFVQTECKEDLKLPDTFEANKILMSLPDCSVNKNSCISDLNLCVDNKQSLEHNDSNQNLEVNDSISLETTPKVRNDIHDHKVANQMRTKKRKKLYATKKKKPHFFPSVNSINNFHNYHRDIASQPNISTKNTGLKSSASVQKSRKGLSKTADKRNNQLKNKKLDVQSNSIKKNSSKRDRIMHVKKNLLEKKLKTNYSLSKQKVFFESKEDPAVSLVKNIKECSILLHRLPEYVCGMPSHKNCCLVGSNKNDESFPKKYKTSIETYVKKSIPNFSNKQGFVKDAAVSKILYSGIVISDEDGSSDGSVLDFLGSLPDISPSKVSSQSNLPKKKSLITKQNRNMKTKAKEKYRKTYARKKSIVYSDKKTLSSSSDDTSSPSPAERETPNKPTPRFDSMKKTIKHQNVKPPSPEKILTYQDKLNSIKRRICNIKKSVQGLRFRKDAFYLSKSRKPVVKLSRIPEPMCLNYIKGKPIMLSNILPVVENAQSMNDVLPIQKNQVLIDHNYCSGLNPILIEHSYSLRGKIETEFASSYSPYVFP